MFIARSAFWLTLAFIVIAPKGGDDLGASASAASGQLVDSGRALIASQADAITCDSIECTLGKAAIVAAVGQPSAPSAPAPVATTVTAAVAPVPPPRPAWAS